MQLEEPSLGLVMSSPDRIAQLLDAPWFLAIELVATAATAAASAALARREGYSLFGALVLAGLAAVGGGILRDILVDRHPPVALARPVYLLTVIATVGVCYAATRLYRAAVGRCTSSKRLGRLGSALARGFSSEKIVLACDAAGLGAFTLVGVWVAFAYGSKPLWLWGPLLATMTTAGGAILRDVVRADRGSAMLKTTLYAEISLVGGFAMTLCIDIFSQPGQQVLLIALIGFIAFGCAGARILAHFHRTPALPFWPRPPGPIPPMNVKLMTSASKLAITSLNAPVWDRGGIAPADIADTAPGLSNPANRYPRDAAASGARRSRLRHLT